MPDLVLPAASSEALRSRRVLVIGGVARSLVNFRGPLLRLLSERGHRVITAAQPDVAIDAVRHELALSSIPYEALAIRRGGLDPRQDWLTARQIHELIDRELPDVVIAYTAKPVIYAGLALRKRPEVAFFPMLTGLGCAFGERGSWRRQLLQGVMRHLYRRGLASARATIFQNPDDRELFRSLGLLRPGDPAPVVDGSGVDTTLFPPSPLPEPPVFLMLARLMVDKGVRAYVDAARRLRASHPEVRCLLAGALDPNPSSGICQAELDGWCREGAIEYLGKLEAVQPALAGCRFYVLPSWYREGIPRSVLEAMATGRPIITTDAPGCRETVVDGVNGLLVTPRSVTSLADAMRALVEADAAVVERMAQASLARVAERFDVRLVNRQLLAITDL